MRILIADDEPMSRRLLEATLTRLGHEPMVVSDGLQARAVLRQDDGPQMAILDWMMPGLDGLAVCRAVRTQAHHYVYVILLTAHSRHEDMVAALRAEADDFLTKPFDAVELNVRITSGARILDLQTRLIAAQDALRYEATHDRLTALHNRGTILDTLTRQIERSNRVNERVGVAMVDVDEFKRINDAYGHAVGDRVLRLTADSMKDILRPSDAIGRFGGEEFLIVLPDCDEAALGPIGERIRLAGYNRTLSVGDAHLDVTVSVGMASVAGRTADVARLIRAADRALYDAKARGRNCVVVAGAPNGAGVHTPAHAE